MQDLWCKGGYYQLDPVQEAALAVSRPFLWSHKGVQSTVMQHVLRSRHDPVISYLLDTRMTCGVTVPIRLAGGDLATFTAIRADPRPGSRPKKGSSSPKSVMWAIFCTTPSMPVSIPASAPANMST
ncbi:autoinducer binding domain-containing protein [Mesorhizobium sp.]|uniref:autoinducer binding domain-containing protein n=1 Tax=Mesorhizobium sp. TaxID=1871066 RepID=UPI00258017F3|nr:autoinducer binding domain-containing protein [Mesorhizobium sp.]